MIDACPDSAVLFFDVDGTLTSFDPDDMTDKDFNAVHPSKAVVDAFGRLRNAGHQAFICTGRPLWLIADSLRALDPAGIVAMAGATLEVEGRVVHEDCFDEDVIEELAHRIAAAGGEALFETNGATYSLEPVGVEQSFLLGADVVHGVDQMRVDGRLRVGKVCVNARDLACVANDDGFIDRNFELCNTGGQNRELSPKGIDKGVGVARALAYLGREGNARTFGFGDSGNDLGMLAAVETAVAMGNAMPEVKAVADYVTDDVAHDGTVTAMRHFGLI
ncbi:HAD-IIB family hydrolase [Collinsella sp. BIOML-A4]|uniref:HAD-IIB family hydrolase n=1 Tax=unclassified Collinsella TaxID=2637548 RepID=UPI00136D8979|nr:MULTISPECIES: HAD-IIB family hydrolase [unclassified Collinsella]MZJ33670.1 HAD-IIB family hydrolase [Collinsella sp. BIOML-A1]MZJ27818.1 HAD-IIB family hydrolase [Collinsella sp. BIOML-A2]MZJ29829.1 HAD-IIB family hydrolase [Collinsella sp. BIOML-A3]MZJ97586.1 HAD-IIB family hydrolase [Collinsella sp. BIOML-A6]MZK31267.1 HAD-IIB family hydrolase [Collinsella sp. BIOML-A5]